MVKRLSVFSVIMFAVFLISACGNNVFKGADSDSKNSDDAKFFQAQIDLNNREYDKVLDYCKDANDKDDDRIKDVCVQAKLGYSGIGIDLISTLSSKHDARSIISAILPSDISNLNTLKDDARRRVDASKYIIGAIYGNATTTEQKRAVAQNLTADQSFQVVAATMNHITGILEQVSAAAMQSGQNLTVHQLLGDPTLIQTAGAGIYSQYAPELDKLYDNLQFLHTGQDNIDKAVKTITGKVGNQTLSEALLNNLLKK